MAAPKIGAAFLWVVESEKFRSKLLVDLSYNARTNGTATLTDSEAKTLLASDGGDQLNVHVNVVAGAAHLNVSRKVDNAGNVGGSEVELRTVAGEEGLGTAAFLLGKNVNLAKELGVRLDGAGLCKNLTSLDLVLLDTTEQETYVIAGLSIVHELVEHLDTGYNGLLLLIGETYDLNNVCHLDVPLSTRPVATVPRPEMENTSSTGIRKGRSAFLSGVGI